MLQPHLQLPDNLGIRCAILPGDPARVERIKPFLENTQELAYNREFRSLCGTYRGIKVLAVSTGIGGCSAGIALEELHYIGVEAVIRIGSCGALQSNIAIGDLILAEGAIRDEGTSVTYAPIAYPAVADAKLFACCVQAAKAADYPIHCGIVHSHESFYHDEADELAEYWSGKGALGADMETAALFTVARLRSMRAASILNNVVLWGADTADAISSYVNEQEMAAAGERREIRTALDALAALYE